jgi:tight adherence protein C
VDLPFLTIAIIFVPLTVFAAAVWIGNGVLKARENTSKRLMSLQPTRSEVLSDSFSERAVAPIVGKMGGLVMRFTPQGWAERTTKSLIIGGFYPRIDANSWAVIRVVSMILGFFGWLFFRGFVDGGLTSLIVILMFVLLGFQGPQAILKRRINDRRAAIEKDLPDVIDLLVISVEAGLGFEAALGRVVQNVPGDLSDEFSRMLQETRVGVSRHDAMKSLAERTDVDDLNSFILAMNQADAFGVSVSRMLRVQADEIRVRRRQRAQERAFAAPVKMVFPLVLCIFPSIFVVLLGPAVIQISNTILS